MPPTPRQTADRDRWRMINTCLCLIAVVLATVAIAILILIPWQLGPVLIRSLDEFRASNLNQALTARVNPLERPIEGLLE